MLVLSRKPGEEIVIGDEIRVTVLAVRGNQVRLGIVAPRGLHIRRCELEPLTDDADEVAASVSPNPVQ